MEMTTKEIADELGVDKQKVYRYIKKNHINEVHHEALQNDSVKRYDEAAQRLIISHFTENEALHEVHHEAHQNHINDAVIDTLLKQSEVLKCELEAKNKQIAEMQKLLDQEQKLRMAEHQKILLLEEKEQEQKKGFWNRVLGKGER